MSAHILARGLFIAAVALCSGCCDSVDPTAWQGTMNYAFSGASVDVDAGGDGGDGGATSKPVPAIGATNITVTLNAFAPWVQDGFSGGYCGGGSFSVDLGPSCQLMAHVASTGRTGSASIAPDQTCTLTTPSGTFTVSVQGGSVAVSSSVVDVLLDALGANIEFQGNVQ